MLQSFIIAMAVSSAFGAPNKEAACIVAQARATDADVAANMILLQPSTMTKDQDEFVERMQAAIQVCISEARQSDVIIKKDIDDALLDLSLIGFRNRLKLQRINPAWIDGWLEAQSEKVQLTLGCNEKSMSLKGPEIESMRAMLQQHGLTRDFIISKAKFIDNYLATRVMVNRASRDLPDLCE